MEFKAFQVNEFDTVAARSMEEAVEWYKKEMACGDDVVDADVWEVSPASLTWDYVDPFTTPAKEYVEIKAKVLAMMKADCGTDAEVNGRRYMILCGDLFAETVYAELLKRVKEPMILTTTEW